MNPTEIDVTALAADNQYVAAALGVAVDWHREVQCAERDGLRAASVAAKEGAGAALESLAKVLQVSTNMAYEDAHLASKGHIVETCGWFWDPKGLDEWLHSDREER